MDLKKAILNRCSRRNFLDTEIDHNIIKDLQDAVDLCNNVAQLSIEIVLDYKEPFDSIKSKFGFKGARNFIALVGPEEDPNLEEKSGYYGESLVLLATALGLGTCWATGSFDRNLVESHLNPGQKLVAIIAFGNVNLKKSLNEIVAHKGTHIRKQKQIKDMLVADPKIPNIIVKAMEYVVKAPSAFNKQPVIFYYNTGRVIARVKGSNPNELIDLGIAKLHFEIGVGSGKWKFGNGCEFEVQFKF